MYFPGSMSGPPRGLGISSTGFRHGDQAPEKSSSEKVEEGQENFTGSASAQVE
eukprot:CAMPEP_0174371872 /NCGR_PEP_ID=MMETSP0811_2-20130205/101384_1 /TAXON_ID=73025 ORGANISM="Eutreptiella gymnastica-like, Strain CCMP1594" /NCGR_SAMPLE_ID=MMETSP0811_2 /ASSEMBLY_ACC=CAM_ASM_000667 /LENGTH=52 /DNA_ID=CAMNT_0015518699 /DNA_START=1317 /DNA_END=1472 /DNA_ORIENTATION=+